MKGIIFIRHAETDLAGTFCGHTNPPLNALGESQVIELITRLASEPIEEICSSDLCRAVQTSALLAQAFSLPYSKTPNLREINFGAWEAMAWTEIEKKDADFAHRWVEAYPHLTVPQGEPFVEFEDRVLQEVNRLLSRAADKRIAVVTHAGVMRVVLHRLLGHSEQRAWELTKSYCSFFAYEDPSASAEVAN